MSPPRLERPLIGLLDDGILPGEERSFSTPVLDAPTLGALPALVGKRVALLFVASRVELPSFVAARWATEARVVSATSEGATFAGERRVRIVSARGKDAPYAAEVEPANDAVAEPRPEALVKGAHALFAALEAGAVPEALGWEERLGPAVAGVVRALVAGDGLKEALRAPPGEALRALAQNLAARAPAEHALCELEATLRKLGQKPEPTLAMKHRLWAACVEIQKRLDVYDPSTGDDATDVTRLSRRLEQAGLPKVAREVAKRELRLLRAMKADHHDYSNYTNHLDWLARLPWHPDPPRALDLAAVEAALEREHAGLEKAKRRVLEYLAVRSLGGTKASMVLCLAGPPGVGKTSIARAMAEALGRPFVRVPLGGVHDESELRGHRMSFQASAPGRLVAGIARAGSMSSVVLLDELDKMGADNWRSPYGALLEALDPEQNAHFQDNYLAVPYDLSHVLFIATVNDLGAVNPTLLDRLEVVELEGYTVREKEIIARRHLAARLREEHGLPAPLAVDDDALRLVIEGHTREAGVRQLSRALGAVHRARALALVRGVAVPEHAEGNTGREAGDAAGAGDLAAPITVAEVERVLGPPRHVVAQSEAALPPGVATGLSVGADGGALLFVEVVTMPGKGELRLTGRLGDVMRESAQAALAYLRADPARYGVAPDRLERDVHVHVPEGATPKEGPSAGLALVAALVSAATGRAARGDVALTGEITLTGRVLPVGGVRAKVLAAERAGIRRIVVPEGNRADVPEGVGAEIVFVGRVEEGVEAALGDALAEPKRALRQDEHARAPRAGAR
jgi:endopeptidase La